MYVCMYIYIYIYIYIYRELPVSEGDAAIGVRIRHLSHAVHDIHLLTSFS